MSQCLFFLNTFPLRFSQTMIVSWHCSVVVQFSSTCNFALLRKRLLFDIRGSGFGGAFQTNISYLWDSKFKLLLSASSTQQSESAFHTGLKIWSKNVRTLYFSLHRGHQSYIPFHYCTRSFPVFPTLRSISSKIMCANFNQKMQCFFKRLGIHQILPIESETLNRKTKSLSFDEFWKDKLSFLIEISLNRQKVQFVFSKD